MDSKTIVEDLPKDDLGKENIEQTFYTPLCLTGYLTPLQRQKLRERRGLTLPIPEETKKEKVLRIVKRKKENNVIVPPSKRAKNKELKSQIPQIQCSAARIVGHTNNNVREKKFFKHSSPSRLEKANFSISFVCKKNLFSVTDKNIKDNSSNFKKHSNLKENNYSFEQSHSDSGAEDETNITAPCIIKINTNSSDIAKDSVQVDATEKKFEDQCLMPFDFDFGSDEEFQKRQEEYRASIKKQKRVVENVDITEEQQTSTDEPVQKLYPIFYIGGKKQQNHQQDNKRKQKNGLKKPKESSNGGEQLMIDAGQKRFGATLCSTCNMLYHVAADEDERLHLNYHNTYLVNLKFPGWKEENVIGEYTDGRIIIIHKSEQSFKIKKIEDVLEIANRDLGFSAASLPSKPDLTFLLFISNAKQVAGCVVAEPISQASRVLRAEDGKSTSLLPPGEKEKTWRIGNWYASSETVPAICGVNRIWVAHNYRRSKVASRMIDCLRCHFVYGHVVSIDELAFTDPSLDGAEFAASYTGTDHFLVYRY